MPLDMMPYWAVFVGCETLAAFGVWLEMYGMWTMGMLWLCIAAAFLVLLYGRTECLSIDPHGVLRALGKEHDRDYVESFKVKRHDDWCCVTCRSLGRDVPITGRLDSTDLGIALVTQLRGLASIPDAQWFSALAVTH